MKTIQLWGAAPDALYHTRKNEPVRIEGGLKIFKSVITGYLKGGGIEPGDQFQFNYQGALFEVTEVLEERNHAGNFENPEDRINSYLKVRTKTISPALAESN